MSLDLTNHIPTVAFVPSPVEVFSDIAELNDEMLAQVFGLDLTPLLPPKANELVYISAHDDPSVRSAYK